MKSTSRQFLLGTAITFFLTVTFATLAQEPPAPPSPPAAPAPQAEAEKPQPAAAPAAAAASEASPAVAPSPAADAPKSSELRRLDTPSAGNSDAGKSRGEVISDRVKERVASASERRANRTGHTTVNIFGGSRLAKGEQSDVVIAILGSATSEGDVTDAVVAVLGDVRVTGPVGDAAVAVLGNNYVNSHVRGDVVAVLGNVELGPEAEVGGEVVCVGGTLTKDPKAIVHKGVQTVGFGHSFGGMAALMAWFHECLFYGRPLAFSSEVAWAWAIAAAFLVLYVLLALLFRGGIDKCVETLESRPGYSVLTAFLTVLLSPVVMILLIVTGIGIFLVPFVAGGLFFASLFGKAVMLAWLGGKLTRFLGNGPLGHPAFAVLVGGVIVMLLYTVPVLGFIVYKLFGWVGMGVVVYTLVLGLKREKPASSPSVGFAPAAAGVGVVAGDLGAPGAAVLPTVSTSTLPRAGFWIRMGALLIDLILVGIIAAFMTGGGKLGLVGLAAYGAVMWKIKGTTIGGIICGLKVVRIDDRPIDWGTAIVRALGCFLSLIVLGLGFIWVAFDDDKQSWHDKIAGTTVVRVPKGVSLV